VNVARRLGSGDLAAVQALLARNPAGSTLLHAFLDEFGIVPPPGVLAYELIGADNGERGLTAAVLVVGRRLAVAVGESAAGPTLAAAVARSPALPRVITGPRELVDRFWDVLSPSAGPARVVHAQRAMTLDSRSLRYFAEPTLVPASELDVAELLAASEAMFEEETGLAVDVGQRDELRHTVESRVAASRTWVLRDPVDGRLLFKASIAARSMRAAQLEGVWVPPEARRRGIARRAVSELCRRELAEVARLTLFVNEENAAALRLYQRIGFTDAGPWRTLHA
jgi:ribosomal protein S18 acetylase RimI-like enzyme